MLNMLLALRDHMYVAETSPTGVVMRPPLKWTTCGHQAPKMSMLLGKGEYGKVEALSKTECVKTFVSSPSFYHELLACDLIELAKIRTLCPEKGHALISFNSACMCCRKIFFPRYSTSLSEFPHWTVENIPLLVRGFDGLLDAVVFLNEQCGLFHSDISLCNILVEKGVTDTVLGKLVLADMGLATLHSGNTKIDISISSSGGRTLYQMFVERGPFMVCKDAYKPACVLWRCFKIASAVQWAEIKTECLPICPNMAKVIDISCLAYCLLNVIEKIMDVTHKEPTDSFYSKCTLTEYQSKYYLKCLVHKVVLLEFLSRLWKTKFNIGVNSQGSFHSLSLTFQEKEEFRSWCRQLETQYICHLYPHSDLLVRFVELRDCVANLLSLDYFSPCGREI